MDRFNPAILVAARELGLTQCTGWAALRRLQRWPTARARSRAVDKIAGPGNLFVVIAKRLVYGQTGIESLPGPTETLVLADDSADPRHVAADLLAQAEHLGAEPVLVSTSRQLLIAVQAELGGQLEALPEPNRGWARDSVAARMKVVLAASSERDWTCQPVRPRTPVPADPRSLESAGSGAARRRRVYRRSTAWRRWATTSRAPAT